MHILFYSSWFFIIPCIYAFINKLYIISAISFCNTICSTVLWYNYNKSRIHNFDVFFAKLSFIIYFIYSCILIYENHYLLFHGMICCFFVIHYYLLSFISLVYRLDFHIVSILSNLFVVYLCTKSNLIYF
jgi:hypothetical protein